MALSGISLSLSLVGQGRLELHRLYIRQVLSPIELLTVERIRRFELRLTGWHPAVLAANTTFAFNPRWLLSNQPRNP